MSELIELIKMAALDAVARTRPVQVVFGQVIAESPPQIQVDQKLILQEKHLIPGRLLQSLERGNRVVLLQAQGGQQYLIVDRLDA